MKLKINNQAIEVKGIKTDSREVKSGDLFIAYKGVNVDGHNYIDQAIEKGATVIVGEKSEQEISNLSKHTNIKYVQVKDGREMWSELESQRQGYPQKKLKIIGVTGTDGKTTTANFIYEILKNAGRRVGILSTVSAKFGDVDISTGLHVTSPDPDFLFETLKKMVDTGVEYLVLEVTSHALIHKRVHGLEFVASCITNISPEHLDAHGDYLKLISDKAKIVGMSKCVFLNSEGVGFDEVKEETKKYGNSEIIPISASELEELGSLGDSFRYNFPGDYNLQNAALAYSVCEKLGVSTSQIIDGLNKATPPIGRFQRVDNDRGLNIIVDFAHTENSMKNVLTEIGELKEDSEKIITVFGCAGERDQYKRPAMGKTSSKLSDIVIVTSEDPRSEDPMDIINQVIKGNKDFDFITEPDRKIAIKRALEIAKKGDWVLFLGKGHEQSMNVGGIEHPWDDVEFVKEELAKLSKVS